jgi:CheY-like chemotaxis protein
MRVPQVLTGSKNTDSPERETTPATILIADDEEVNRMLLSHMLRRDGHQVVLANDGEEAACLFVSRKVDLALLDVLMPHRTGFEVCRMIKTNPQTRLERKHRDLCLQRIRVRPRLVW